MKNIKLFILVFSCLSMVAVSTSAQSKGYLQYAKQVSDIVEENKTKFEMLTLSTLLLDNYLQGINGASKKVDASGNLGEFEIGDFYKDIVGSEKIGAVLHSISEITSINHSLSKKEYMEQDLIKLEANVRVVSRIFDEMEATKAWGYAEQVPKINETSSKLIELWRELAVGENIVLKNFREMVNISR